MKFGRAGNRKKRAIVPWTSARTGPRGSASKLRLYLVKIGEETDAPHVVKGTVQRRPDRPGGPLEKPDPKLRLEALDHVRRTWPRNPEISRGLGEAAAIHDPDEEAHGSDTIHAERPSGLFPPLKQ